jgi:hypothetical protein
VYTCNEARFCLVIADIGCSCYKCRKPLCECRYRPIADIVRGFSMLVQPSRETFVDHAAFVSARRGLCGSRSFAALVLWPSSLRATLIAAIRHNSRESSSLPSDSLTDQNALFVATSHSGRVFSDHINNPASVIWGGIRPVQRSGGGIVHGRRT